MLTITDNCKLVLWEAEAGLTKRKAIRETFNGLAQEHVNLSVGF